MRMGWATFLSMSIVLASPHLTLQSIFEDFRGEVGYVGPMEQLPNQLVLFSVRSSFT